jgi:DNA-binding MarR family transcriptional regulator
MDNWPTGRLLSTAARLVEHAWAEALEARGLTHAGLIALHFLDAGPLNQTELARQAKVEAQTMSRTIDRLERRGLVRREADPGDRRRMIVTRTGEGDAAWASTRSLESEVFPVVSDPAELRAKLLEIIEKSGEGRW